MLTESKVTEISYMTDNFCKEFIFRWGKQMIKIAKCNKPNPAKNLNLNGQKQARKVLKLVKKNIPLFLKKRHEEFLKTSNVFSKTSNVFFKTTVCFKEPSLVKYKSLIMKQIRVYPYE